MGNTKIKICGLRFAEDIAAANSCKPDYVGFVFAMKKREVSDEEAARLKKLLDPDISAVGVFVNAEVSRIVRLLSEGVIDIAQLHGQESDEEILQIQKETGKPVIKAIVVRKKEDFESALSCPADYLLFDGGTGSGEIFDWGLLEELQRPFFLAGGLNPENIQQAICKTHPYCVDLSSGVETYPGSYRKDPEKMKAAVFAVRNSI